MKSANLVLYSKRVVLPDGLAGASIIIEAGQIVGIERKVWSTTSLPFHDFGNAVIMPGLIDAHVHINDPGRSHWEGFYTATKAAIAGGITTLVDMPLNSTPVTTSRLAFEQKLAASEGQRFANCGFWGGLVPESQADLADLLDSGVLGIKVFLTHSGIDDFPNVTEADLHQALPLLAQKQVPLLVHCELDQEQQNLLLDKTPRSYAAYLQSRPKSWENKAIELMIRLCQQYHCPLHIVHLSSAEALPTIEAAKATGMALTVETCPHYLYFDAAQIGEGQTLFKCAPPIREKSNQLELWQALKTGLIDFVATDHSPAPPDLKQVETGNFATAWGGIASLQLLLPAIWTAAKRHQVPLVQIAHWTSSRPAQMIGWAHRKGQIAVGFDADLVIWNPEAHFCVSSKDLFHRHSQTPYLGEQLYGQVQQTYLAGQVVYDRGAFANPQGALLLRK